MHGGGTGRQSIGAGLCFIEKNIFSKEPAPINGAGFFIFTNSERLKNEMAIYKIHNKTQ